MNEMLDARHELTPRRRLNAGRAFAYLERAYEEHDGELVFISVSDAYANLRSDPRFPDLLRRIRYPEPTNPS